MHLWLLKLSGASVLELCSEVGKRSQTCSSAPWATWDYYEANEESWGKLWPGLTVQSKVTLDCLNLWSDTTVLREDSTYHPLPCSQQCELNIRNLGPAASTQQPFEDLSEHPGTFACDLDLGSVEKTSIHLAHLIVTLSCCSLTTSKQRLAKTCSGLIVQADSHLKALLGISLSSTSDGYPKKSVDRIPFSNNHILYLALAFSGSAPQWC